MTPANLNCFHIYKNKILTRVLLDLLQIEETREPTPSIILEVNYDHNSDQESIDKSIQGSELSQHQSQNQEEYPKESFEETRDINNGETTK